MVGSNTVQSFTEMVPLGVVGAPVHAHGLIDGSRPIERVQDGPRQLDGRDRRGTITARAPLELHRVDRNDAGEATGTTLVGSGDIDTHLAARFSHVAPLDGTTAPLPDQPLLTPRHRQCHVAPAGAGIRRPATATRS